MKVWGARSRQVVSGSGIVFGAVLLTALLGIASRPVESLASFWPANAVLLGLWIRFPRLFSPPSILAAFLGFVVADLVTGSSGSMATWLTIANLAGVFTGLMVARRSPRSDQPLQGPESIATLLFVCAAASCGSALVGSVVAPELLGTSHLDGFGFWFSTEFANFIVILPIIYLLPVPFIPWLRALLPLERPGLRTALPAFFLALSLCLAAIVGGTGAIAIPVPFMIWCSLAYPPGAIALVNLVVGVFFMVATTFAWLDIQPTQNETWAVISVRVGVSLLALGPLALAIINRDRLVAWRKLEQRANLDSLTGLLNRSSFDLDGVRLAADAERNQVALAALMLDIDHFKRVNDDHGHQVGDQVLKGVADLIRESLPSDALIGRLGGEEYAALLPGVSHATAKHLADQLRRNIDAFAFSFDRVGEVRVSASCGVAVSPDGQPVDLYLLLGAADRALYQAKAEGRNRVRLWPE